MKTDTQLQADVLAELKWEPSVNATGIGVQVKDGVVTLSGHVGTYFEKLHAERAAQRVADVKALAIELTVRLLDADKRDDADIARTVKNVLDWSTFQDNDSVKVMVEKGWITLTGSVDWQYQRQAASDVVRHLMGVTGVSNQIVIKAQPTPIAVKTDIEAALARQAKTDAQKIHVQVADGAVTLTGTVKSWSERDAARNAAWGTPGVRNVVDRIGIGF